MMPGSVVAQETENHELADEHHHKNHIALFIGATEAEAHHGDQEDPDFTLGMEYERTVSKVIGVGALVEFVVEGKREYVIGAPLFVHIGPNAIVQLAPVYWFSGNMTPGRG